MISNEFDRSRWVSIFVGPEPDIAAFSAESSKRGGQLTAELIQLGLKAKGLRFPAGAKYLALAAGQGHAELAVAATLSIDYCNITFVDKRFYPDNLCRLKRDFPAVRLVEQGMFAYLENPDQTDFSLLTAFGIEYVLDDDSAMETLIRLAPRLLRPGAVVAVDRREDNSLDEVWQERGFKRLIDDTVAFVLCVFDPVRGK